MKKNDNIEKDAAYLRANIAANEKRIELPESLSGDSVTELVSGGRQKKNKKAVIKGFIGAAVAACVALGVFTAVDYGRYSPKELNTQAANSENGIPCAGSYDDIVSIVKDYAKYQKAQNTLNGIKYAGRMKSADAVMEASDEMLVEFNGAMEAAPAAGESSTWAAMESYGDSILYGDSTASRAVTTSAPTETAVDFADTNTRVEGIGEADTIKTDGEYIYLSSYNNMIGIFKPEDDGTVTLASVIDCNNDNVTDGDRERNNTNVIEFYVYGDKLAALVNYWHYSEEWMTDRMCSGVLVYDISDRNSPELIRSMFQDGSYVSSRVVGSSLLLISNYYIDCSQEEYTVDNVIPGYYCDSTAEKTCVAAEDIAIMNVQEPDSYVVVGKAELEDVSRTPETIALFGGGCEVYCTADTLYAYNTNYCFVSTGIDFGFFRNGTSTANYGETTTNIFSFDITGNKPALKAQGKIDGYLLNTYSLDEYNGYLRAAATKREDNIVYVLDGELHEVGRLEGIAPGEVIKSVRFSGNTAYVVTFIQTDPLFVIDLTDPANPAVKGEVKLPGFSSYLHPVGDGLMLGIGEGGTEAGVDGSAKISLFDVSDPTSPFEADSLVIPNAWLNTGYKAFVTVKSDGSFLIPLNSYADYTNDDGIVAEYGFMGATGAIRVAVENGKLVRVKDYMIQQGGSFYYYYDCDRVTYIDDTVFLTGGLPFIASFDMTSGEKLFMENYSDQFDSIYREHNPEQFDENYDDGNVAVTTPPFSPAAYN